MAAKETHKSNVNTGSKGSTEASMSEDDRLELEKLKQMYAGKNLNECFALMQLSNTKEIRSVREELGTVKERVSGLESVAENLTADIKDINEVALVNMRDALTEEEIERQKLEQWGRKWNVVIHGIVGDLRERPRVTGEKVRSFMTDTLKLEAEIVKQMSFAAVHRLPGGDESKRRIILRFVSLMDRDDVMDAARRLPKGSGHSVIPDLNPEASKLRAKLLSDLRAMEDDDRKKHRLGYILSTAKGFCERSQIRGGVAKKFM